MNGGIFMPLASSLQFFDGTKSYGIFECKREISAIDMQGYFIAIGEKASPGQLISAVLLDIRAIDKAKIFNYQKTQINFIAVSPDG
jgi:hypothetical protein